MAFRRVTSFMPSVFANNKQATTLSTNENSSIAASKKALVNPPRRAALGDIGNKKTEIKSEKGAEKPVQEKKAQITGRQPLRADAAADTTVAATAPAAPVAAPAPVAEAKPIAKLSDTIPENVEDIDAADEDNPQLVAEYVKEIYAYMLQLETRHRIPSDYMSLQQKEITSQMRGVLIDWMVGVHLRFKLLQETLFMTIEVMDRFLSMQAVSRSKLQLVGVTSMLIAAKYEETYPPIVSDMITISDNAYSRAEVLAMESTILKTLDYNLGTPLPLHFLRRYSKAINADTRVHALAKYFMELKMLSYTMADVTPSETAAAALYHSRKILLKEGWCPQLEHYSGYKEEQLESVIQKMSTVITNSKSSEFQAVQKKYSSVKFMSVSVMPELLSFVASKQTNV